MERDDMTEAHSKKRGREDGDHMQDNTVDISVKSSPKKQLGCNSHNIDDNTININDVAGHGGTSGYGGDPFETRWPTIDPLDEWDSCISSSGVFDFPWLRDGNGSGGASDGHGMIFKTDDDEESKVGDAFSLSSPSFAAATDNGLEFYEQLSCPEATALLLDLPSDETWLLPDDGRGLSTQQQGEDLEGLDCIWSSLLNQPLIRGL